MKKSKMIPFLILMSFFYSGNTISYSASDSEILETLLRGVRFNNDIFRQGYGVFELKHINIGGSDQTFRMTWGFEGQKVRHDIERTDKNLVGIDLETRYTRLEEDKYIEYVPSSRVKKIKPKKEYLHRICPSPLNFGIYVVSDMPVEEFISVSQQHNKNLVFRGSEEIYGSQHYVLEINNPALTKEKTIIWIDPSHGYRVRKIERWHEIGISVTEVLEFKEYKDGIWFAQKGIQRFYDYSGGVKTLHMEKHFSTIEFTANTDLPVGFFDLNVPPDTWVNDQIVGITYEVP